MADNENINIVIKARGGRQAAAEVRATEAAIEKMGRTVGRTRVVIDENTKAAQRSEGVFASGARMALRLGAAYAGLRLASAALHSGINFVSTMEQNQIAFEQFLGSTKAAQKEIADLRALTNDIPAFGFDVYATNAKKLLAMGTPLKRVNRDLRTFADTALGLGLGAEGIDRLTLAIGQMRSTGVVQGDELRQLQEAGIKVYDYMIQAGVITREDIGQIGNMHIEASRAIDAIMNGMAKDFGGLSSKARSTWAFQIGQLKNNAAAAAGALVEPIMKLAESKWLPTISAHFHNWAIWLNSGGAERLYDTMGKIAAIVGPIAAAFGVFKILTWAIAGLATLGGILASMWGTLSAIVGLLPAASSLGDVLYLIASAFGLVEAGGAIAAGAVVAAVAAVIVVLGLLYWKVQWFRNAVNSVGEGLWWLFGETIGGLIIGSIVKWAGIAWDALSKLWGLIKKIGDTLGGFGAGIGKFFTKPHGFDIPGIPFMASGGTIPVGGAAIVGEAGPELARNRGGGTEIVPLGGGAGPATRTLQPIHFAIDGRVFAEAMLDIGQTAAARA